jgi:SNF2 family DNA or RNA helicase
VKTFGTAKLLDDVKGRGKKWFIEATPHVMIKLKRVFSGINKPTIGTVTISDTPENARELEWFVQRYPLNVEPANYLQARADKHRERTDAVERLLAGTYTAREFDLAVPAREYQKVAASMLLESGGLLLADDVGLGKTASAIATFTDPRTLPVVVVTLTHLPKQWESEIKRFAPKLRVHIVKKGTPYDLRETTGSRRQKRKTGGAQLPFVEDPLPDVVILNYHKLAGWADALGFAKALIFDEVQELRHAKHGNKPSDRYEAARLLREHVAFCMGLSATPIYNYGGELYNVLSITSPGALGTLEEFNREWCDASEDKPRIRDPRAFGSYVREAGLMLRRTRAEVGRELPALTKIPHHIDADEKELDKVAGSAAELARVILRQGAQTHRAEKLQASEEFSNKLRQATGIAKAPFVAEFVRLLVESEGKVVVFAWHREVYAILMEKLADLFPVMYTGSESPHQKEAAKRSFVDGASKVLIISLRSGAGLDGLQGVCRTVVFAELDWSPGVHEQCTGRIYRDGQKEAVVAYFLVAEHGADPVIADVLQLKQSQSDGVRDPKADILETLTVDSGNVKRLAEAYLKQQGLAVPEEVVDVAS